MSMYKSGTEVKVQAFKNEENPRRLSSFSMSNCKAWNSRGSAVNKRNENHPLPVRRPHQTRENPGFMPVGAKPGKRAEAGHPPRRASAALRRTAPR
jgi:hypothetical protein